MEMPEVNLGYFPKPTSSVAYQYQQYPTASQCGPQPVV